MPAIAAKDHQSSRAFDDEPGVVSGKSLHRSWMKVLIYGRPRAGKSTLSAQWPKPLVALACEPRENGGADSIKDVDGVSVAVVQLKPLPGESDAGTTKIHNFLDRREAEVAATGKCRYQTITLDTTALQDIILAEIMGWDTVDTITKRPRKGGEGGPGLPQFMARAEGLLKVMRRLKDLPCDVIFLGQEKDHNPARDDDGKVLGSKMVVSAQEKSYMSVYLGESSALWLENACQFICQLYMDNETKSETTFVDMAGVSTPQTVVYRTGKYVRRLRMSYHPNYASGCTVPGIDVVPEYIEAATPREMYEALVDVASGKRTSKGKYQV